MENNGWKNTLFAHSRRVTLTPCFILLITLFPALLSGCSKVTGDSVGLKVPIDITLLQSVRIGTGLRRCESPETRAASWELVRRLDVFVFNDDALRRLDSYSRTGLTASRVLRVDSGIGEKIVVVIANLDIEDLSLYTIGSLDDLERVCARYAADDPQQPVMSGITYCRAGVDGTASVVLQPVLSEIEIKSIDCPGLEDVSVYLLNAPAECGILAFDEVKPSGYLHQQRLREGDLRSLKVPSMSYHYLGDPGEGGPYLLYCYPNQAEEESIGSPFTRLVVEGTRGGQTRYYPVNLNRRGYGYTSGTEGVGRNVRYSLDLHLRSEGSLDPDRPDLRAAEVSVKGSMTVYPGNIVVGDEGDVVHVWCEVYPEDTAVSFNKEDLEYERERGIFDYELDQGGHGVLLRLRSRGSALINVSAGPPVDDGTFVVVAVRSPS